jgi:hypothetical protein
MCKKIVVHLYKFSAHYFGLSIFINFCTEGEKLTYLAGDGTVCKTASTWSTRA